MLGLESLRSMGGCRDLKITILTDDVALLTEAVLQINNGAVVGAIADGQSGRINARGIQVVYKERSFSHPQN
jgi:hypothetical protein